MQSKIIKFLGLQDNPLGVGKSLGKHVWIHRSALRAMTLVNKGLILSVMDDKYCVARIEKGSDTFQLSLCPSFDLEREPKIHGHKTFEIVGQSLRLIKSQLYQTSNLLIFHHKHLFVYPTYTGFDIHASVEWSCQWKQRIANSRSVTSRIGRVNGWHTVLSEVGLQ